MGNCCCCCTCICGLCNLCGGDYSKSSHAGNMRDAKQLSEDMQSWKTGDIILQHSAKSYHSMVSTNSPWAHVAIVYVPGDGNGALKYTDEFGFEDATVCVAEAVVTTYDHQGKKYQPKKFVIDDARKWIKYVALEDQYIAHRSLKTPLTQAQLQDFQRACEQLFGKEYGGQDVSDLSAVGAACDCCGCCSFDCCPDDKANLEKVFCSEAAAYLLKSIDVMHGAVTADEMMPANFDKERGHGHFSDGNLYEDIVLYGEGK